MLLAQQVQIQQVESIDRPSESDCNEAFFYGFFVFMAIGVLFHALYLGNKSVEAIE